MKETRHERPHYSPYLKCASKYIGTEPQGLGTWGGGLTA